MDRNKRTSDREDANLGGAAGSHSIERPMNDPSSRVKLLLRAHVQILAAETSRLNRNKNDSLTFSRDTQIQRTVRLISQNVDPALSTPWYLDAAEI